MREKFIPDYKTDDRITDFFIASNLSKLTKKSGEPYIKLKLKDKKGEIEAVRWEIDDKIQSFIDSFESGAIVKARGTIDSYNGKPQFKIDLLRVVKEGDEYDETDLVKASPLPADEMYDFLMNRVIGSIEDDEYKTICEIIYNDHKGKMLYWPAGKGVHHDEKGGLLWHTYRMALTACKLCEVYSFINRSLLVAGVVLHDIGKIYEMDADTNGVVSDYTDEGSLLGHLVKDVVIIEEYAPKINMTPEKKLLLEHVLATHHGEPDMGALKKPNSLEALLVNHIDMMDMNVYVAERELQKVEPGTFTQKLFALNGEKLFRASTDDPYERAEYHIAEEL